MPSVPASNGWPAPSAGSTSGDIASRAVPDKSFQRSRPWQGQWAVRPFEHAGARARGAEIRDDLRAVERFFDDEASRLAAAIAATGFPAYPVPHRDRDLLSSNTA